MAVRRIRMFGDAVLRAKATPVDEFGRDIEVLVRDLAETLVDAGGTGLAAPQIGVLLRVFVYIDLDPESPTYGEVRHLVNPEIVERSVEEVLDDEGCLSIPGRGYELARPRRLVALGVDARGEPLSIGGTERVARCLAHETDHLDGVLFIDRLEPALRKRALREIRELMLAGDEVVVKRSPHGRIAR